MRIEKLKGFMLKRIKKTLLFFWFSYEKICYFFNFFLLAIYRNKKKKYKFLIKERIIGARLAVYGFRNKNIKEKTFLYDNNFCKVFIENKELFIPKNIFQNGEVAYAYQEIFTNYKKNPHSYENNFLELKAGDVVFDVGACEGFFTMNALNKNVSKIYSFEPLETLCLALEKNFDKFIKNNKCLIIREGLSNKIDVKKFSTQKKTISMSAFDDKGDQEVKTTTIDFFVKENNLQKIDFIKMDIENAEIDAIKGAFYTLGNLKPKLSIAVYHGYENAEIVRDIILSINSSYTVKFGGCYMFEKPYRPYMLYAY